MTLLEAIIEYLASTGCVVGDGIDCFRDFMPESPDAVVVLHEYAGDPISPYTESVHRSVQVKVRHTNAAAARMKAICACAALRAGTESRRIDFSEDLWGQVYVRQTPFKLSQDESNRVTYCFNLGITTNILE